MKLILAVFGHCLISSNGSTEKSGRTLQLARPLQKALLDTPQEPIPSTSLLRKKKEEKEEGKQEEEKEEEEEEEEGE